MSDARPVESKVETAVKIVETAAALTSPTTAPIAAVKAGWWATRSRKRLALVAGGAAIVLAGGGYGYKYFTAQPGKANAQGDPPAVAEVKPELTPPVRPIEPELDIKPPVLKPPPIPAIDIDVPDIRPPASNKSDTKPPPIPSIDIDLPDIKPPMPEKIERDVPTLIIPPSPKSSAKERKPDSIDSEIFKAPDPLPSTMTEKKEKPRISSPVIRTGVTDTAPPPTKKDEIPSVPDIDIKIPPPPTPAKKDEIPSVPDIDIKVPPAPMPKIGPAPTVDVAPPPVIKSPMIPDVVSPPMTRVDVPPPPLIDAKKKDMYDEDWHTQREGDTYTIISKEYYKTADYAQALEAYNKDRRKPGERIIRVPPTWVLEEQFPNLAGAKPEKPEVPEVKPTGSVKFEPATPTPTPGSGRPAPPPAGSISNDEYKVKDEAGATIRELARRIYGSPDSWKKLWELNPNLDPTQPIPFGTTLRLGK